ncbi:MAG: alpha/beta hydrolase family protein [Planctomycetota bacterium]|jgi:dienelactone hydrolase
MLMNRRLRPTNRNVITIYPAWRAVLVVWVLGFWANLTGNCQEVDWLASVTDPPASFHLDRPGSLAPLLIDAMGMPITTWDGWLDERARLRQRWRRFLGPMPFRPEIRLVVLATETLSSNNPSIPSVTRQWVGYEGEPGWWVEGYLLIPQFREASVGSLPGIVALHPTTNASIDAIAGVDDTAAAKRTAKSIAKIGLNMAERGYVVFCPRCFLWQNAESFEAAVANHRQRHPNTKGMAKMLYDAMRGVDVLESLPYVDRQRIGAIGHSLGAKEVLYLMAFDDRVRVGVASEGGLGFRSTNWNAPWYLTSEIDDESFPLNHHQLLGLIAPRPLLILGGESGPGAADGERSWVLIDAALPVWRLSEEPIRLGLLNHRQGHTLSKDSFEKMAEWMQVYLRRE